MAMTQTVWITRQATTMLHVKGLLQALEQLGLLDYGEVRIMAMAEGDAIEIPPGFRLPDDTVLAGGAIMESALPPQGLLLVPDPPA